MAPIGDDKPDIRREKGPMDRLAELKLRSERTMTYDPIAMRRAELQRQIVEAQRGLDTIQLVPVEDTYPDGAVIKAEIRYGNGDLCTYVFLKVLHHATNPSVRGEADTRWYHTGSILRGQNTSRGIASYFFSWREFQLWLIERGRVVESWEVLMPAILCPAAPGNTGYKHISEIDLAELEAQ